MVNVHCSGSLRMMASCHEELAARSGPQPLLFIGHGAGGPDAAVGDSGHARNSQLSRKKTVLQLLFQKGRFSSAAIFLFIFA
jgi:hypothetical protein